MTEIEFSKGLEISKSQKKNRGDSNSTVLTPTKILIFVHHPNYYYESFFDNFRSSLTSAIIRQFNWSLFRPIRSMVTRAAIFLQISL